MDHGLELFIPILEILEIEVSNILYNLENDSGVRPQTVDMGNACEGLLKESWQGILEEKS